jgi:hypothetical protein
MISFTHTKYLISRWLPIDSWADSKYSVDSLDKGMTHVLGKKKLASKRFYHTTHSNAQFKSSWIVYFWSFLIGIFKLWLTIGEWSYEKQNHASEKTIVFSKSSTPQVQ